MTSLEAILLSFLANALWQAPVLVAVSWVGARLLRRAPAAYRHRLWLVTLALVVVSPAVSAGRPKAARPPRQMNALATGSAPNATGGAATGVNTLRLPVGHSLGWLGRPVSIAYLVFVFTGAIRLANGWRRTRGLVRRSEPAPISLAGAAADCAAVFAENPRLRISSEVAAPMTFGLRRPVIVFPAGFAQTAAAPSLRGALAHELGHVVRRDCAWNLACEIASLPLSFHPAVRFLKRRLVGAREAACDEAAASLVGTDCYARTLLEVAATSVRPPRFAGALGVLDGDALEDRMRMILDGGSSMDRRKATLVLCALLLGLAMTGRWAAAAAVAVTPEAGPSDMVGRWTATMSAEGSVKGRPAADLTIALTPSGPDVALTLYRYRMDGAEANPERPPVVRHSVKDGVLHFRTRVEDFRLRAEDPPSPMEADWEFAVVGADAGELTSVRNSKVEALAKAQGKDVPPPPPPVPMKRVSKP